MLSIKRLAVLAAAFVSFSSLHAQITTYSSRVLFNAAAPGLPLDTFGPTLHYTPYPLDYFFHTRPVSSTTNDTIFPSGSM